MFTFWVREKVKDAHKYALFNNLLDLFEIIIAGVFKTRSIQRASAAFIGSRGLLHAGLTSMR